MALFAVREVPFPPCADCALGLQDLPKSSSSKEFHIATFADLGASKQVSDALRARSITEAFPIQEMVMRDALDGHDLLVQSPTGSGKTLAFGVPVVELVKQGKKKPQALILAPTRELASQIVDELRSLVKARGLYITAVYGGVGFGRQIEETRRADILVATPGRLEDLIQRQVLSLKHVRYLVLDEADRMLDMGFRPAVDRIVAQTAAERQTLFFSATLEGATGEIAAAYTTEPRSHTHAVQTESPADIEHRFLRVESQSAKLQHLVEQLDQRGAGRTLVFVRTKRGADRLVKRLAGADVSAVAMHGDKTQRQRERALARFEKGQVTTLVATDVAARGIDVNDVTQVINFDIPEDREGYVHRIGRTGRAGNSGTGISFILDDQVNEMRRMTKQLGLEQEFASVAGKVGPRPTHSGNRDSTAKGANSEKSGNQRRRRRRRSGPRNTTAS